MPMRAGGMLVPRQVWLATLGAAAVTREWAEKEAGGVFRTLVREGSAVESRAIRYVGRHVETSMRRAHAFAREARHGVRVSMQSLADAASIIRQKLPTVRAVIDVEAATPKHAKTSKPAARARKSRVSTRRTASSRAKK
jgi:hypothetical protein